jgi:hypothetical protein
VNGYLLMLCCAADDLPVRFFASCEEAVDSACVNGPRIAELASLAAARLQRDPPTTCAVGSSSPSPTASRATPRRSISTWTTCSAECLPSCLEGVRRAGVAATGGLVAGSAEG